MSMWNSGPTQEFDREGIIKGYDDRAETWTIDWERVRELLRVRHRLEFEWSGGVHEGFRLHLDETRLDARVKELQEEEQWDRQWEEFLDMERRASGEQIEADLEKRIRSPVYEDREPGKPCRTTGELANHLEVFQIGARGAGRLEK